MSHADEQAATDAATLRALQGALPGVEPPPDLLDRILGEVEAAPTPIAADAPGATPPSAAPVVSLPSRRTPWRAIVAAAAVAAAAASAATYVATRPADGGAVAASAAVVPAAGQAAIRGEARLYAPDTTSGRLVVKLADVPATPPDSHYEVWVLRRGAEQMEAVGAFATGGGAVRLDLPLPGAGDYAAMDISVEENDGPAEHSQTSLAGASFS